MNITLIRKKQVTDDNQYDELIKRLDEHIRWMKELQKKSEEEKLVEWVSHSTRYVYFIINYYS